MGVVSFQQWKAWLRKKIRRRREGASVEEEKKKREEIEEKKKEEEREAIDLETQKPNSSQKKMILREKTVSGLSFPSSSFGLKS